MQFLKKALPVVVIIAFGIAVAAAFITTRPKPEMVEREARAVPVQVMEAVPATERIEITAWGTVIPARELTVMPEVSGKIVEINDKLVPGGYIREGEVLVRIDDRDYKSALSQASARVAEARSALDLEQGRQEVARREWEYMKEAGRASGESSDLALRKPQLDNARAALESARSAYAQARLNLERTTLKAPFNAVVRQESAEVGQFAGPQSMIAKLAGADNYWVQVSVPLADLAVVTLPGMDGKGGASATVIQEAGEGEATVRTGHVVRLLGDLDPNGRMARMLIEVEDPLGLKSGDAGLPLLIDSYVKVSIDGKEAKDVFVIPREAMHEDDTVWVMNRENLLEMREAEVLWRRDSDVLVSGGLSAGENVVVSGLSSPLPGMLLTVYRQDNPAEK